MVEAESAFNSELSSPLDCGCRLEAVNSERFLPPAVFVSFKHNIRIFNFVLFYLLYGTIQIKLLVKFIVISKNYRIGLKKLSLDRSKSIC